MFARLITHLRIPRINEFDLLMAVMAVAATANGMATAGRGLQGDALYEDDDENEGDEGEDEGGHCGVLRHHPYLAKEIREWELGVRHRPAAAARNGR